MKFIRYDDSYREIWDGFVCSARNGHFFFNRDFMEYHSHIFTDFSILVFNDKDDLITILPANIRDQTLFTHEGLTFGGFLLGTLSKTEIMVEVFEKLLLFLNVNSVNKIIYKAIPYIYHKSPAQEDLYALFRVNGNIFRRYVTAVISLQQPFKYQRARKRLIKTAAASNLFIEKSENYSDYWDILNSILDSVHNVKPVHSLDDIKKLANLFPNNIKLYLVTKESDVLAGAVIFENDTIAHVQYGTNSYKGRDIGALDYLYNYLITEVYKSKKYFNFGTSNDDDGTYLNGGLIAQKEGFGARAVVQDSYEINF